MRELAAKKAFLQGCDREGHPVLVVWAARHDMGDRSIEETKRFICYCLDNTIAAADFSRNPRGQILCLFDLSGASAWHACAPGLPLQCMVTASQHYAVTTAMQCEDLDCAAAALPLCMQAF